MRTQASIISILFTGLLLSIGLLIQATTLVSQAKPVNQHADYPIGAPTLTDLWVDPVNGDDDASGASRDQALRTITAAWQRIPRGAPLTNTGYRLQLVAGDYPESSFPEYWEDRHGTAQFPIILQAADGPRTALLLADNTYPLPAFPAWDSFTPAVAPGLLTNRVETDRNGIARPNPGLPGAYLADSIAATPTGTSTPTTAATTNVRLYLPAIANRSHTVTPTPTTIILLPLKTLTPTPTASATATATPTATATSSGAGALPAGPVTLVMLGDSLTIGQGDESAAGGGYPRRLLTLVQGRRPGSTVHNLGQSGWTSADLIQGVNGAPGQLPTAVNLLNGSSGAKAAFLWIGSNNLWYLYEYGNPNAADETQDGQNFTTNLDTILQQLTATGATVFVALLDDQSQRPVVANPANPNEPAFPGISAAERQRMGQQVIAYNNAINAKAAQYGARVVDFYQTTIFTTAATLADDGNHPNAAGYDAITARWFDAIGPLLTVGSQ